MADLKPRDPAPAVARWEIAGLAAVLALAALLRMYGLGAKSFWVDELFAVARSGSLKQALAYCAQNHEPPLRYVLLHFLLSGHPPELFTRLPSFVFGVATVGVLWLLVRSLFGARTALLAAALLTLSPWHLDHCQDARMYAVMMFLWTLSLLLFFRALEQPRQVLLWPALAVVHALNFYLSYLTVFVLAAQALTFAGWLAARRLREGRAFALQPYGVGALIFAGFFGFCLSFWLDVVLMTFGRYLGLDVGTYALGVSPTARLMTSLVRVEWPAEFSVQFFVNVLDNLLAPELIWRLAALAGVSAGLVLCWRKNPVFVWTGVLSFLMALLAIRFTAMKHFVAPRYVFHLLLFSIIFSAVALDAAIDAVLGRAGTAAKRRRAIVALAVAAAVVLGLFSPTLYRHVRTERQDWRGVCRYLNANARPGDLILTGPWGTYQAVLTYGGALSERCAIRNSLLTDAPYKETQDAPPGTTVWYVIWGYMPDDLKVSLEASMDCVNALPGLNGTVLIFRSRPRAEAPAAK